MEDYIYETSNYYVTRCSNALGEDGKYGAKGYAVVNKKTDVVEHTSMMMPGAIFQCQHFSDTLDSLLAAEPKLETLAPVVNIDLSEVDVPEDVVPS